jgi:hypothetical protein
MPGFNPNTGALSLAVKRSGPEADHSPPSSAEVKEWVELYLHSPNTPSWRGSQLKKHRDSPYWIWGEESYTGGEFSPSTEILWGQSSCTPSSKTCDSPDQLARYYSLRLWFWASSDIKWTQSKEVWILFSISLPYSMFWIQFSEIIDEPLG